MNIKIERVRESIETEVTVRCAEHADDKTESLLRQLELLAQSAVGYRDGVSHRLAYHSIYYIDSVNERTFLYTERDVYETAQKLYEWEKGLEGTSFVRISKSTIVNTDKLKSVRPMISGRLEATLRNGEKQIVNRHYVSAFRQKFGI